MLALRSQWNSVKEPLEQERASLKDQILSKRQKVNVKLEEIKQMRSVVDELSAELSEKEPLVAELAREYEAQTKETSKMSTRQFYTRRILEICSSIDKQRKEIDKVLIESRTLQKEINNLSGKLERIFNSTDELLFKVACFICFFSFSMTLILVFFLICKH